MDAYEAAWVVFSRIQRMEPENVSNIMGSLLSQDNGDQEMIRLAFGPDALLHSLIVKAKKDIPFMHHSHDLPPSLINTNNSSPFLHPTPHGLYWGPRQLERPLPWQQEHGTYLNCRPNSCLVSEKALQVTVAPNYYHEQLNLKDHISLYTDPNNSHNLMPSGPEILYPDYMSHDNKVGLDQHNPIANGGNRASSISHSDMNVSVSEANIAPVWKPCVYFARGYCKHGSNCRFFHGYTRQENNNNNNSSSLSSLSGSPTESRNPDENFQNGSIERLEIELQELLRGKRVPVSIAALPQLYYEKYGKTLQAEGYLTESQRHGKAGYSLTKLLARLKDTVTLIDRPHGQHAIVLAEDAPRFMAYRGGVDYLGGLNSGSRQIYLTFPAESTFTEEDVSNYFRTYGPVHDVRIPYQQKRMFGFVTFIYPETVKIILAKGNPHYVCGARVLVKPYREKGKVGDRKYVEQPKYVSANNVDTKDYDHMNYGIRIFDNSEIIRKHMEEQEQAIELETRRLAELHLAAAEEQRMQQLAGSQVSIIAASTSALVSHTLQNKGTNGLVHSEEESRGVEDLNTFSSNDHFGYVLDVLENNEDEPTHESNEDQGRDEFRCSYGHILPESPFANITGSNGNGTLCNSEETKSLLGESMVTIPKTSASVIAKQLACSMCLDAHVDPKQLECNHALCFKCMPKVGEMAHIGECPICQQPKSNRFKLRGSRDLQDLMGKRVLPASRVW